MSILKFKRNNFALLNPQPVTQHGIAQLTSYLGAEDGVPLKIGLVNFSSGEADAIQPEEEILYCIEGAFSIRRDDVTVDLVEGDMVWIPKGSSITFLVKNEAKVMYIIYGQGNE